MSTEMIDAVDTSLVKPEEVNKGDLMYFKYWGKVTKVTTTASGMKNLEVSDVNTGGHFGVKGDHLIAEAKSADQYTDVKVVSRGEIANIFVEETHELPLTVKWTKKNGETRVLRGKVLSTDDRHRGYIYVADLDKSEDDRIRQVDTRTIEELIVDNVKYTL